MTGIPNLFKYMRASVWLHQVSIVVSIVCISQFIAWKLRTLAFETGERILEPLTLNYRIQSKALKESHFLQKEQLNQIINLYEIVENYKNHHKAVFLELYQYHFASVTILLTLSSISAVVVFSIAQTGWKEAKLLMRTTFFTLAALTTFYAFSPIVFKQDVTITSNLNSYIQYNNIQNELYNYGFTQRDLRIDSSSVSFTTFHTQIINNISTVNNIDLQFDYKSISVPKFYDMKK